MPQPRILLFLTLAVVSSLQFVSCASNYQRPTAVTARKGVVPPTVTPTVEPLVVEAIAPADAVAINNSVGFVKDAGPAARPFILSGTPGFERANDCLAAAVYYEAAGEGEIGERAVAQVVLNRVRHPAYPKSVCGVVFQGSERRTGCQFTFTCDGALARTPSVSGWAQAQSVARAALQGRVYAPVGYATHYHTDWVVPVWRTQLDKLVQLGTHIFYRWAGSWGRPPAFRGSYAGDEGRVALLAALSPAHATLLAGDPPVDQGAEDAADATPAPGEEKRVGQIPQSVIVAALSKAASPDDYPGVARSACNGAKRCSFSGWTDAAYKPIAAPSGRQKDAMSFSYVRDEAAGVEKMQWNCREFRDRDIRTCMKMRLLADIERDDAETRQ